MKQLTNGFRSLLSYPPLEPNAVEVGPEQGAHKISLYLTMRQSPRADRSNKIGSRRYNKGARHGSVLGVVHISNRPHIRSGLGFDQA